MAAYIYVAPSWKADAVNPAAESLLLEDDGYYWHLYRYFEGANLNRQNELIDLYGGAEIDGYQLDRLEDELAAALRDAAGKPDEWKVLTGWHKSPERKNEIWKTVEKPRLADLIRQLLGLIAFAREHGLKLIVSGD